MDDGMVPPTVLRFVNAAFPSLRVTRRRTLCQAELARALPGTTTHLHKKKRLHRFAKDEAIRPLTLLARMLAVVCQRFGFRRGQVPISLDWTPLRLGRRTSSLIRLAGRVMVEHGGERRLLQDWPLEPGEWLFLEGAYLRQDQALRGNLVLYWGRGCKEPWYLATDLGNPQQAVCLSGQRAWIDELFRDLKTHLGLEESRVAEAERLERLMLGLVGLSVVSRGCATRVISWGKASFIFLAREYMQGRDPPRVLLRWKEVR
mgnify:CR=1 FL=1